MFCSNCGNEINDNDKFCAHCGHKVEKVHQTEDDLMPTHIEMPEDMIIPDISYDTPKKQTYDVPDQRKTTVRKVQPVNKQSAKDNKADGKDRNLIYIIPIALVIVMIVLVIWFVVIPVLSPEKEDTSYIQNTEAPKASADKSVDKDKAGSDTDSNDGESITDSINEQNDKLRSDNSTDNSDYAASSPEKAVSNYVNFFVGAVNSGDFSSAYKVMKKNSSIYNMQESTSKSLYSKGVKESVRSCGIRNVKWIGDNECDVTSSESIYVQYSDGTDKTINQSYTYKCVKQGNDWVLTDMK